MTNKVTARSRRKTTKKAAKTVKPEYPKIAIVSTAHAKGFESFGKKFLEEFFQYMPKEVHLHFYTEGYDCDILPSDNLFMHKLEDVERWKAFQEKWKEDETKRGIVTKGDKKIYDYRHNALGFSAKIFPLQVIAKMGYYDIIIMMDSDVRFKKKLSMKELMEHLDPHITVYYLGRKDYPHTETGFVVFNMHKTAEAYTEFKPTDKFINRMVEMYDSGNVFKLEGWTDSYVFDAIRKQFEENAGRLNFKGVNLSEGAEGLNVWPKTWLAEYMDHLKGPAAKEGVPWLNEFPNTLIGQAVHTVSQFKPRTILDIGVLDGARGVAMAKASLWSQTKRPTEGVTPACHLWAVDPFGKEETVAINRFETFAKENPGFSFTYINAKVHPEQWNPELQAEHPILGRIEIGKSDFAYVDGEHKIQCLERDLLSMCPYVKMVMTPTYFLPNEQGQGPDTNLVGCNEVLAKVPHKILPAKGEVEDGGVCKAAVFGPAITPGTGKVQTKNAVPDEQIHSQIAHSLQFDPRYKARKIKDIDEQIKKLRQQKKEVKESRDVKFVQQCEIHDGTALIIAGGPSVANSKHPDHSKNWKKIKEYMKREDVTTFVVKTTHDHMIYDLKIIPDACILLDPRNHVQDFISDPHPEVTYICASMCHPTTWQVLIEKAPKLIGYNAAVKAGEIQHVHNTLGFKEAAFVGGGSSSATRGIGIMHALGFRKFIFAGFDQCYSVDTDKYDLEEKDAQGRPRFIKTTIDGVEYLTAPILLAAAQDIESSIRENQDIKVSAITTGMVKQMLDKIGRKKLDFKSDYNI